MKIEAVCSNPDDVEFTITMTATLAEWKKLRDSINKDYHSEVKSNVECSITNLILQFERAKFMPKPEETDDA